MNNFIPEFMEVLTTEGWMELKDYKQRNPLFVLNKEFKYTYLIPKVYSKYTYNGPLLEIETESCQTFLKPNSKILIDGTPKKVKDIRKHDLLSRFYLGHRVDKVTEGIWEGNLHSLFFGEELYLPIRFEKDYCLLIV